VEALNQREWSALADLISPDFEWHPAMPGAVEASVYRGRENGSLNAGLDRVSRELEIHGVRPG
jgi:hypothetical protein